MNSSAEKIVHPIPPVFDSQSRVLILGTMPSPKSRESGFYYGHPQNRFWRVLAALWNEQVPETTEEKRAFALQHGIALWDVLASCSIVGASDASIRDAVPNPIGDLLRQTRIHSVVTTGKTAGKLYQKFCFPQTRKTAIVLPSTSPANCRIPMETLITEYKILRELLQDGMEEKN